MKRVVIHTDGACSGNPGPGGWAAVLAHGDHRKELSGGAAATTNNRMELQAAIEALRALKEPCEVELFTDSEYVRQGITQWLKSWKVRGWRTSTKQPVKNDDLWRQLDAEAQRHQVTWQWVRGHAGHADNERCDQLARLQVQQFRSPGVQFWATRRSLTLVLSPEERGRGKPCDPLSLLEGRGSG